MATAYRPLPNLSGAGSMQGARRRTSPYDDPLGDPYDDQAFPGQDGGGPVDDGLPDYGAPASAPTGAVPRQQQSAVASQDDAPWETDDEFDPDDWIPTQDDGYVPAPHSNIDDPDGMSQAEYDHQVQQRDEAESAQAEQAAPVEEESALDSSSWDTDGYQQPAWLPESFGAAPAGWDANKWNNPDHQTPKYVVGRILSQYNLQDEGQRAQAIADIQRAYPGTTFNGKDKIDFPGIGPVDIFGGASSGEYRPQWLDLTAEAQEQQATGALPAPVQTGGGNVGGGNVGGGGGGFGDAGFSDSAVMTGEMWDAYRDALLGLLNTDQNLDPEALYDSPEMRAHRLAAQRAVERNRAQYAERAALTGDNMGGGHETALQGIEQSRGEGEVAFMGQLAVTQMERQRDNLLQGIQMAQQAGQFDIATEMQREMASLNAAIERERISMQSHIEAARTQLGYANLGFDYQQLAQQGQIAGNQLGFNYAQLQQQANENAIRYAMGIY